MPSERIYAADASDGECDLLLQWEKAGQFHERDVDEHVGWVTVALARSVPDPQDADSLVEVVEGFVRLDRTSINRIVEKLRRARAQAFGADQ